MVVVGVWVGVVIGAGMVLAEEPPSNAVSYLVKSWRTGDGLPQNSVNAIAQTPDGYLWIGTRGGLARFDGVRFTTFGISEGLKVPIITALVEDGQGGLWIGTQGGGLSRWRNGVITTLTAADGLAHNVVLALARASDGGLWVGTRRGLQHWGPDGFRPVGQTEAMRGTVMAIAVSPTEGVWFSVEGLGLCRYQDGRCENVEALPKSRLNFPSSLLVDAQGDLWIGMGNSVVMRRHASQWFEFNASHGVPFSYIYGLAQAPSGEIWAGSREAGLFVFRDGRFNAVPGTDAATRCITVCPDGMVWVGTQGGGLFRLTRTAVTSFKVGTDPNRGAVYGLTQEPSGHLWACTYGAGVFRGSLDQRDSMQAVPNISTTPFMRTCLRMRDGTVYFAGTRCLAQRDSAKGEIRNLGTTDDIRALCEGADGSLWIGTAKGRLKRLVDGVLQDTPNGDLGEMIHGIARGPGSALWVSTSGAGLIRWDSGRMQRWTTAEGLPTDNVRVVYPDAGGTLWIGTVGGGLAWLDNGRMQSVNARQGLGDDVVSQILDDELGNLWLGCHRGIFRVSKQEVRDVAAGRAAVVHPLVLNESDGMINAECTGGCSPVGLRSASGMLCFSTVRGIVVVDPRRFDSAVATPAALIEKVALGGRPTPMMDGTLAVPPGTHDLEIEFTAFNYAKPERLRFRYRLAGQGEAWADADLQRSVRFSHLPPGDYLFEVSAANPDGRWSQSPARLAFTVQAFYWQTTRFRVLVAVGLTIGIGGIAGGSVRGRIRKHRAELDHQRALVLAQERLSLAAGAAELGIWERDLVRGGIWANDRWRVLYGFDQSEQLGLDDVLRRLHPDDRESVTAQIISAVQPEGTAEKEYRIVLPNGELRWIATRSRTVRDIGGKPIMVRGVAMEVTVRKRSELLQRLLGEISTHFIDLRAEDIDRHINEALGRVANFLGFNLAAISKLPGRVGLGEVTHIWTAEGLPAVPPGFTELDFPWVAQCIQQGQRALFASMNELPPEACRDRETYKRFAVESAYSWPLLVGGVVVGCLSFCSVGCEHPFPAFCEKELTLLAQIMAGGLSRSRTDQALRESEARLTLAADAAAAGLWSLDLATRQFWLTMKTRELFEFPANEGVTFDKFLSMLHPDDQELVSQTVQALVQSKEEGQVEFRIVRSDGTLRWMLSRGRVRDNPSGEPDCLMGVSVDITERKQAELEIAHQRNDLAHLSRVTMLGELAGSMAHELNQPLTAILSNAEAAQMFVEGGNPDLAEIGRILGDIVSADKRAGDIIQRLRSLLKKEELIYQPLDLNEVLQEVLKLMRSELVSHEVTVETELAGDLPRISGDRVQIQQVLINLILNACDAMSRNAAADRQMVFRTESENAQVKLSVIDCGCGIPAGMLEKIFGSFVTTKSSGIGLGLSVCRRIIDAHQGRIFAANNSGRGACFCVILPAVMGG